MREVETILENYFLKITEIYEKLQEKGYEERFKVYMNNLMKYFDFIVNICKKINDIYEDKYKKYPKIKIKIEKDKNIMWMYVQVNIKDKWYDDKKWYIKMDNIPEELIDLTIEISSKIIDKLFEKLERK